MSGSAGLTECEASVGKYGVLSGKWLGKSWGRVGEVSGSVGKCREVSGSAGQVWGSVKCWDVRGSGRGNEGDVWESGSVGKWGERVGKCYYGYAADRKCWESLDKSGESVGEVETVGGVWSLR
eukprot:3937277-Rhodomonas_salina.3